ncbi:MAG: S9 family peptidase [Planctomycetes bacterium]|nr:S9 family peptidase [Planctomycetota bacterium]
MSRSTIAVVSGILLLAACSSGPPVTRDGPTPVTADLTVTFRDRTIDLEPFLIGQPYGNLQPDLEHGQLFYFERTPTGSWLRQLELPDTGRIDLSRGRKVCDVDWSKRSFWQCRYHASSHRLFITSDEENDEHMNVYTIDLATGAIDRVTDNDYTYGWSLSPDGDRLAYLARSGSEEPFTTRLIVRDLAAGDERTYRSDQGSEDRFTWAEPRFFGETIITRIQHDGQRNTTSLARIAPDGSLEYLVPPRVVRFEHDMIDGWARPGVLLWQSAETGHAEVYRTDLNDAGAEPTKLTDFREELRSVELLDTEPPTFLAVIGRPHESELRLLSVDTGEELAGVRIPANVSIRDAHGDRAILSVASLTSPFRFARLRAVKGENAWRLELSELADLPAELAAKICQVVPERVSIPTFDLADSGQRRELHAFYLEPRNPPEDPAERRVLITAFYGGENSYRTEVNILAAAGIAVLSPAPRGSDGFGAEFAALNDGDLGGDEIVDIIECAHWLVEERGYRPDQVGVYGGSHGGYATLRCLTFPPETNGRDAHFDFGFGWSHAGFSDILSFYQSCNIPDWVIQEAGDPATEAAKLRDRSPYTHVDLLNAPVLLTHGENDWRVPVTESRKFVERARALGRDVTYVEFPGQGHGIRGFENQVRYYQAVLSFIESLDQRESE